MRISPWWLLVGAIAAGAALTGIAGALGSEHLTVLDWLGTTATVAALVVAVGIYRLQEKSSSEAHVEMMQQLEAQAELLDEFAKTNEASDEAPAEPAAVADALTADQRASVEDEFGVDSIEGTFDPGRGRGKRSRARQEESHTEAHGIYPILSIRRLVDLAVALFPSVFPSLVSDADHN